MYKTDDGYWIRVSNAQDEGFHYYQLNVDGVNVPDPGTQMSCGNFYIELFGASWPNGQHR